MKAFGTANLVAKTVGVSVVACEETVLLADGASEPLSTTWVLLVLDRLKASAANPAEIQTAKPTISRLRIPLLHPQSQFYPTKFDDQPAKP
jgi:hypothetical protein